MRPFVRSVSASVAAAAIVYFALEAAEAGSLAVRLAIAAVLLTLGIVAAWATSRGTDEPENTRTTVADRITAEGDITAEHVDIEDPRGDVGVATNLRSGKAVRISDVRIGPREDSK